MKTFAVFLLALGLAVASAQPTCRVYKTFNAVANTGMVQDTIVVPDTFPVGSVRVSNLVLGHPNVSSLQLALMQRPTANEAFTQTILAPAQDQVNSYTPQAAMNAGQPATGQYVLRITDSQPGAEG
jgi:subtilisin-like proprotein convertase family protein